MGEIRTVTTLSGKRAEIEATITRYEALLKQARADLAHIAAAIAIFEASGEPGQMRPYVDVARLWKRGELVRACKEFLAADGPLSTRQLAERAMERFGLDRSDRVFIRSVSLKITHAMRQEHKRGKVGSDGRIGTARIWSAKS
jgi:hypothetical protein